MASCTPPGCASLLLRKPAVSLALNHRLIACEASGLNKSRDQCL